MKIVINWLLVASKLKDGLEMKRCQKLKQACTTLV